MSRLSKHEQTMKLQCLEDAFTTLKSESELKGKNIAEMKAIVTLANQDKRMIEFTTKIGDKSVYAKGNGSIYPPFVKKVKNWEMEFKKDLEKANKKAKSRVGKLNEKLLSHEAITIQLQEQIHELKTRLLSKDRIIANIEEDRNRYAQELNRLRQQNNIK